MKIRLSIEVLFACCVILALISGAAADQDPRMLKSKNYNKSKYSWGDGNKERLEAEKNKDGMGNESYKDSYADEIELDEEDEPYEIDLVEELRGVEDWIEKESKTITDNLENIYAKFTT